MGLQGMHKGAYSSYMEHLPALYHEALQHDPFFGNFLKIFERIWSGYPSDDLSHGNKPDAFDIPNPPIEETIDHIQCFFSPKTTPIKYLLGLGSWLNLNLNSYPAAVYPWIGSWHQEMLQQNASSSKESCEKEGKVRLLLRYAASFLLGKGTLPGLIFALNQAAAEYLRIDPSQVHIHYARGAPRYEERERGARIHIEIVENFAPTLAIGIESTIGLDTRIIDSNIEAENTFTVYLSTDESVEEDQVGSLLSFMVEIIDEVKPAHAWISVVRWRQGPYAVKNFPEI
ncbi:MAG: hypothetical protein ACMUIL_03325 [bacterium]